MTTSALTPQLDTEPDHQYVKLPDGSYGKFAHDADNATIRGAILRDFPDAFGVDMSKVPGAMPGMPGPTAKAPNIQMNPVSVPKALGADAALADAGKRGAQGLQDVTKALLPDDAVQRQRDAHKKPVAPTPLPANTPASVSAANVPDDVALKQAIFGGQLGSAINQTMPKLAKGLGIEGYGKEDDQILHPEALVQGVGRQNPSDKANPVESISTGVAKAAGGLTSGDNLLMMALPEIAPEIMGTKKGGEIVKAAVGAGFTAQMLNGLYENSKTFRDQMKAGDSSGALETLGSMGVDGVMAVLAGKHAVDTTRGILAPKPVAEGRPVLHGTDDPETLRQEATQQAPGLSKLLDQATKNVPGAKVAGVRDQKDQGRVAEKVEAGKPVETQSDHLAGRITVETPEAKEQVSQNLAKQGIVSRDDNFDNTSGPNNFRSDTHQVVTAPNANLKSAEVQIVTPEQDKVAEENHELYEQQRTAELKGDTATAGKLGEQLKASNDDAAQLAQDRLNGVPTPEPKGDRGESPEQPAGATKVAPAPAKVAQGERLAGVDGSKTSLLTPSGEKSATYRLVEADDLTPSHNAQTFEKNANYPEGVQERAYDTSKEAQNRVIQQDQNYDARYTVNSNPDAVNGPPVVTPDGTVLGGNSRAMATQRVYGRGGAEYRDYLRQHASEYGVTPEQVDGLKKPVLVREIDAPGTVEETRRVGSDLNKSMTGALGVSEKAVSAGKSIKPDTLKTISQMLGDGDTTIRELMSAKGRELVHMFTQDGVFTERERPQYVDTATGGLSEEGKTFVERALLGSVVDDPRLMDATPKNILGKLERSLGAISSFAGREDEWNLLAPLRQALAETWSHPARRIQCRLASESEFVVWWGTKPAGGCDYPYAGRQAECGARCFHEVREGLRRQPCRPGKNVCSCLCSRRLQPRVLEYTLGEGIPQWIQARPPNRSHRGASTRR